MIQVTTSYSYRYNKSEGPFHQHRSHLYVEVSEDINRSPGVNDTDGIPAVKAVLWTMYKAVPTGHCSFIIIIIISNLSHDRSTASSKTIPPLNAI